MSELSERIEEKENEMARDVSGELPCLRCGEKVEFQVPTSLTMLFNAAGAAIIRIDDILTDHACKTEKKDEK